MGQVRIRLPVFWEDARANRLAAFRVTRLQNRDLWRVYLRGANTTAAHVAALVAQHDGCPIPLSQAQQGQWTHRFEVPVRPSAEMRETLALLKEILTVTAPQLDSAIALDYYKDPVETAEGVQWVNTVPGELIFRGKYCHVDSAGTDLADRVSEVVKRHSTYAAANGIISVPGHDEEVPSFGRRLAAGVARRTDKPLVRPISAHGSRVAAKARDVETVDLADEFRIEKSLRGQTVVIVDDVYRRGETMAAVARAARAAGAVAVHGLAGAKTRRG